MSNGTDPAPSLPTPPPPPPMPPSPPPAPRSYWLGVEPALARKVLAAGVVLYLLVVFVENGGQRKLNVLQSQLTALRAQVEAPAPPVEPDAPKEDDYKDQKEALDKAKKAHEERKKEYDEKLKEYKEEYVEWLEDAHKRKVERAQLEREATKMDAELGDWGYFKYLLRFLASLAIVFGLAHTLFHGSDIERAAAIFLLGTLATSLLR